VTDPRRSRATPAEEATPARPPLDRRRFEAAALMRDHPPVWTHPNKRLVFEIACPPGSVHQGMIGYSRWTAQPLPDRMHRGADLVIAKPGYFDYKPVVDDANTVEWHVNFADPDLFGAYAGARFAQDESQVVEHPALGAVKEALESVGIRPMTAETSGPTPVLITGAERRVAVSTDPDPASGRPRGLYGNAFAVATPDVVRAATRRIDPPTVTNLIAIAAPFPGRGAYDERTIETILVTAYTGFAAAVRESAILRDPETRVAIHSGYWGCGAFGGNRTLMVLLQIFAAGAAGVDRLVFHTGQPGGEPPLVDAMEIEAELIQGDTADAEALISAVAAKRFQWGLSDGI
jgi:hypothetical protein